MALHLATLRRLITRWRERADVSAEREAKIYRQVEADLAAVISAHPETSALWSSIRNDLARAVVEVLDGRGGTHA